MSERTFSLPTNPYNVALGIDRPFNPDILQNAYALPGDTSRADALAPVIGAGPPPTPGQLASVSLPVTGGTIIQQPQVDGLGNAKTDKQYWTGTDLVELGVEQP